MKALTLHQPWASLVAGGVKTVETRSWAPPVDLVGERFAIHAASQTPPGRLSGLKGRLLRAASARRFGVQPESLPRGAVLCTVLLEGFGRIDRIFEDRHLGKAALVGDQDFGVRIARVDNYGDFSLGRWVWLLSDVQVFESPIRTKGAQRLWEWLP